MADFLLVDHGSISTLKPLTPEAEAWIDEHIDPEAMMMGTAIVIEHRYVGDIVEGLTNDGLTLS